MGQSSCFKSTLNGGVQQLLGLPYRPWRYGSGGEPVCSELVDLGVSAGGERSHIALPGTAPTGAPPPRPLDLVASEDAGVPGGEVTRDIGPVATRNSVRQVNHH